MDGYDRALTQLEEEYDAGNLTDEEYRREEREIGYALQAEAEEAAEEAYANVLGYYPGR